MELWQHQKEMAEWFSKRHAGMFAADMGTGKSAAAIESVRQCDKVLICCPVAVGPAAAPSVTNWGTGSPRREVLHADDLADACLHLLEHYDDPEPVNVGTGMPAQPRSC